MAHQNPDTKDGWNRLWDENEQHWYWFNEFTEESQWEESDVNQIYPEDSTVADGQKEEVAEQDWGKVQSQWEKLGMVDSENKDDDDLDPLIANDINNVYNSSDSDVEEEQEAPYHDEVILKEPTFDNQIESFDTKHSLRDINNDNNNNSSTINENPLHGSGHEQYIVKRPSKKRIRYYHTMEETQNDVSWYQRCFYCHSLIFEAPLTILESSIRAPICLIISFICILFSMTLYMVGPILTSRTTTREQVKVRTQYLQKRSLFLSKVWAREGLLFLGAVFTLSLFPCSLGLHVYNKFDANLIEEDEESGVGLSKWELSPLPSVFGGIDPRRFACITLCGQGGDAGNADMPLLASDTSDSLQMKHHELTPIGKNNSPSSSSSLSLGEANLDLEAHKEIGFQGGMDEWKGSIIIAPRNLDRGFPPVIATLIQTILSMFIDNDSTVNGLELIPTHDDDSDDSDDDDGTQQL